MDRVSSTGYQTIGGKRTWQNKNLGAGIQGTTFDQLWFAGSQEMLIGPVEKVGLTPVDAALGSPDLQLWQAISLAAGAGIKSISSTPGSPLAATDAGIILVDATAANISITMPAVASANGVPLTFRFHRVDTSAHTVSIAFHAGDTTFLGGLAGPISLRAPGQLSLFGDGVSHWLLDGNNGISQPQYFSSSGTYVVPYGITQVLTPVWGAGGGGSGGSGGSGGGGGFSLGLVAVTPGASIAVTVGAPGAGASSAAAAGNGGTSSFGASVSSTGGNGGGSGAGAGGVGSGGFLNIPGGPGTDIDANSTYALGAVGMAIGGSAPWGGAGGNINASAAGSPPVVPGGGGAANGAVAAGQSGAVGGVLVIPVVVP